MTDSQKAREYACWLERQIKDCIGVTLNHSSNAAQRTTYIMLSKAYESALKEFYRSFPDVNPQERNLDHPIKQSSGSDFFIKLKQIYKYTPKSDI